MGNILTGSVGEEINANNIEFANLLAWNSAMNQHIK